MLRTAITVIVLCSFFLSLEGQQKSSPDKNPIPNKSAAQRSTEIENLINDARSLPAEFAVDILLRLAASNNVDKKWKREILTEAFPLTSNTQNEFRMKSKYGTPVDSRVNYRSYAFALNLDALSRHIQEINYYLRDNPFTRDDLKPAKVEEAVTTSEYFESKNAGKLSTDLKELAGYDDDEPAAKESKAPSASAEQILNYLRQLEDWDGRSEPSEIDYFHQKCVLYLALTRIVPSGEAREQVMTSYINFLNQPSILKESRIEWMLHARELLGLLQQRTGEERATLVAALTYSKNPILQIYARLMNANIR